MWTEPVVTVAPASTAVSLSEAKEHCRVTGTAHDTALGLYISGAIAFVQNWTGLRLITQTVAFSRSHFAFEMPLPVAPVQSVSIKYTDTAGAEQTLAPASYEFNGEDTLRPFIYRADDATWPDLDDVRDAVRVTAVVGYAEVPADIKAALLLLIGHWFDNREAVGGNMNETPLATMALLENYRAFQ